MALTAGMAQAEQGPATVCIGLPPTPVRPWSVNQDQFEGKWSSSRAELKKQWGEFTDDDLLAIEGRVDKLGGQEFRNGMATAGKR